MQNRQPHSKFWIFLTSLSLSTCVATNAYAESSIILKQNQPAPFSGYLLPPSKVIDLREAAIQRDVLRGIVADQDDKLAQYRQGDDGKKLLWIGGGVLAGIIATSLSVYVVHTITH